METATTLLTLARLSGALFTGACLYIVFVEHPARLTASTLEAVKQFRHSIVRAERMQPTLLIVTLGLLGAAWLLGAAPSRGWLAASLLAAILPLSLLGPVPINRRLLRGASADHRADGMRLLTRWGYMHALRSALALAGTWLLLA